MNISNRLTIIVCILFYCLPVFPNDDPQTTGKEIFTQRCASCHNVNKKTVGPALAGLAERRSPDWIVRFVQSSQTLIKAGDAQALALYHEFNNLTMPEHKDLTEADVAGIVTYITASTKTGEVEKKPFARPGKREPSWVPLTITDNYGFFICCLLVVGLLIIVLLFAVDASELKNKRNPI